MKKNNLNKGFTLLYTTLVISIILSIALSIANISIQQFLLSSAGKESQVAFYNADTGIECAIYNDLKLDSFPVVDSKEEFEALELPIIVCAGQTSTIDHRAESTGFNNGTTSVTYLFNLVNPLERLGSCDPTQPSFLIEVNKSRNPSDRESINNYIRSRGFNTCDFASPRRVERGLEVKY